MSKVIKLKVDPSVMASATTTPADKLALNRNTTIKASIQVTTYTTSPNCHTVPYSTF